MGGKAKTVVRAKNLDGHAGSSDQEEWEGREIRSHEV